MVVSLIAAGGCMVACVANSDNRNNAALFRSAAVDLVFLSVLLGIGDLLKQILNRQPE